jgi:hypothetical protein
MSEQLWPGRLRDASRELSTRWREPLRSAQTRVAAALDGLRLPDRPLLGSFRTSYRRRKLAVWGTAFALLAAVEIAIAFPLLLGPSKQAIESVDHAAQAIASKATGSDSASQTGAAADRGRDALGKGPAGSPDPEKRPAALPVAGGEEEPAEEKTLEAPYEANEPTSAGSSAGVAGASASQPDRVERGTPARRSEPENEGTPAPPKNTSPAKSPPAPQPQSPPPPPVAIVQSPPPSLPPPATSTTTTTRTVALPAPRGDDEDRKDGRDRKRDEPKDPPPPSTTTTTTTTSTTTTTTTTSSPPPPPPTTTTPDENAGDGRRRRGGGGDDDDD